VIDENLRAREQAAEDARIIVEEGVAAYRQGKFEQEAASSIVEYRRKAETWRDAEVERALKAVAQGQSLDDAVKALARNLTNKLLHHPTEMLKRLPEKH
jgi:glutamyl-tRNA reductase